MSNLGVVQSEDVVQDVVGPVFWHEMENLGVSLGVLLLVDEKLTSDHDQHISVFASRLGVQRGNTVSDLGERQRD